MASKKIIGYVLAGLGLLGIVFSAQLVKLLSFLGAKAMIYEIIASSVIIILGIILLISEGSGKVKHAAPEVPIYQGEGKHKKIIGYKKVD